MKAMIVRSVYALVAAIIVAGAMLMTAKPAAADEPAGCFLITHYTKWGSQEIVIDASGWHGHAKHGDDWLADVPCEDELPPV